MSQMVTRAPCAARCFAIARPMPLAPPVTSACRPAISLMPCGGESHAPDGLARRRRGPHRRAGSSKHPSPPTSSCARARRTGVLATFARTARMLAPSTADRTPSDAPAGRGSGRRRPCRTSSTCPCGPCPGTIPRGSRRWSRAARSGPRRRAGMPWSSRASRPLCHRPGRPCTASSTSTRGAASSTRISAARALASGCRRRAAGGDSHIEGVEGLTRHRRLGCQDGAAVRRFDHREPQLDPADGEPVVPRGCATVRRALAEQLELRHVPGREVPAVRMELEDLRARAPRARPVDAVRHERLRAVRRDVPEPRRPPARSCRAPRAASR